VKQYFLRELKEAGILEVKWQSGLDMTSDVFTKNLGTTLFEKDAAAFVGNDEYMKSGSHEGRVSEIGIRELPDSGQTFAVLPEWSRCSNCQRRRQFPQ